MKRCLLLCAFLFACGSATSEDDSADTGEGTEALSSVGSFTARGTGYYPANTSLEGGTKDRRGKALKTLQQFLAGNADYVSVAMDTSAFPYGQRLKIKELESKYGRSIPFRVVDTGGAFSGRGRSRIDICTGGKSASLDSTINGTLHIEVMSESNSTSGSSSTPATSSPPPSTSSTSSSSAATCHSHGDCNPGNEGSGTICVDGTCKPGCTADWQCPGSTVCSSRKCQ